MFVTFFNEWFIFFLGRVIDTSGGTDKLTNFSYHYLAALDQVSRSITPNTCTPRVHAHACTHPL